MLVVISNPISIADEAPIINNLFDDGLEILHLRKPGVGMVEISRLLQKIKPQYYNRISLHQYHEMAGDFGIKRLHFTEIYRKQTSVEMLKKLKAVGYILSTSIHEVKAYDNLSAAIDYTFFGPVFNSISKQGYTGITTNDFVFPVQENHSKVIAIGGIDTINIGQLKNMQFNGAAVLGSIWQKTTESTIQFKALQKAWKQTGR